MSDSQVDSVQSDQRKTLKSLTILFPSNVYKYVKRQSDIDGLYKVSARVSCYFLVHALFVSGVRKINMRFLITEVTVCTATIISLAIIEFKLFLVAVVIFGGRCKHMKEYLSIVASFS